MSIRPPSVAGSFYPGDKAKLQKMVDNYLKQAKDTQIPGKLCALVEPHAGYVYSAPTAAYGYKSLAKHRPDIEKIILIGPSHFAQFQGACESGFDFWETSLGRVEAYNITKNPKSENSIIKVYPQAHLPEHCLEVQLPFLQSVLKEGFKIYPILCGDVNPAELANVLLDQIDNNTFIIASSDLSHYLPYDKAVAADKLSNECIVSSDITRFEKFGDACGKLPILTLMHIAKKKNWKTKLLDYRNSGDTAGPKNQVVGYGCHAFYEGKNE